MVIIPRKTINFKVFTFFPENTYECYDKTNEGISSGLMLVQQLSKVLICGCSLFFLKQPFQSHVDAEVVI